MKSKFLRWFKAQFKELPMPYGQYNRMLKKSHEYRREADRLDCLLRHDRELSGKMTAALYAWNARGKK